MKINELPRYKIRFEGETIGVAESVEKGKRLLQEIMGIEVYVKGYKHINKFDLFDSKTDCIVFKSKDLDPLPVE